MRRHFRLERKGAVERAPKINPETTPHGDLHRRPKEMAARQTCSQKHQPGGKVPPRQFQALDSFRQS